MKKRYLLCLLVLLSGCNNTPSESIPSENVTPTEEVCVNPTDEVKDVNYYLNIIESCRTFSSVRDNIIIYNGKEKIYEVLSRIQYDGKDNVMQEIYQESGKNGLDSSSPKYEISKQIYYDGEYSFSLDSDGIYIREKCDKEISAPTNNFNYDVLKNVEGAQNGFRYVVTASVDDADVATFLNVSSSNITSFSFEATINSDQLEELEFTYTQNNLSVVRNIQYIYYDIELAFPTTYKTLD